MSGIGVETFGKVIEFVIDRYDQGRMDFGEGVSRITELRRRYPETAKKYQENLRSEIFRLSQEEEGREPGEKASKQAIIVR